MLDLTESFNYGDSISVLRRNTQIVLQQVSGYLRAQAGQIH